MVHSDAHDKRAQKKLERVLSASIEEAGGILEEVGKVEYFCHEDAEAAADKLRGEGSSCHFCDCEVREKVNLRARQTPQEWRAQGFESQVRARGETGRALR